MTPRTCLPLVLLAALGACSGGGPTGPACDAGRLEKGLEAGDAAAALTEACQLPAALEAWAATPTAPPDGADALWQQACAAVPLSEASTAAGLARASAACDLGHLGTATQLATATGSPLLAAAVHQWLVAKKVPADLASTASAHLLGTTLTNAPEALALPRTTAAQAEPVVAPVAVSAKAIYYAGHLAVNLDNGAPPISGSVGTGPEALWAISGLSRAIGEQTSGDGDPASNVIAADGGVSARTLRQVAATVARDGKFGLLAATDTGWTTLWLHLPSPFTEGLETVDVPDTGTVADIVTAAGAGGGVLAFPGEAPCLQAPEGMACIPGGSATVSGDPRDDNQGPARAVEISTFYLDVHEVTNKEYADCAATGACPLQHRTGDPEEAAGWLTWQMAQRYCAWAGKRLPTEWEWEKAARGPNGDSYPWGNDPPSCDRAVYDGCDATGLANPGTKPAGHYGLFDMTGNASEWTATFGERSVARCGDNCTGRDPRGPCTGAIPCKGYGRRIVRGGAFDTAADQLLPARRAIVSPDAKPQHLGVRCAMSTPVKTAFPATWTTAPPAKLEVPEAPSAELRDLFDAIDEDPIEAKPICANEGGRSDLDCRDPNSYVKGNEPRGHLFRKYIENRGGAYVGVGSDQNYTYAAVARARWVWFMDYDPNVVRVHKMNKALIIASETPEAYVARFAAGAAEESKRLIRAQWEGDPEVDDYVRVYDVFRGRLERFYTSELRPPTAHVGLGNVLVPAGDPEFGWLRNPEQYQYVRALWQQGRAKAVKGDMLGDQTMRSIGRQAKKMGVPVRIYYTSNAPNAWGGDMTEDYRANVRGLPMDGDSIVMQVLGFATGFGQTGYWHYHVSDGPQHQRRLGLAGYTHVWKLVTERIPTDDPDMTTIGLPSP